VPREKLLEKLALKYGISDHWLRNYLSDRYQYRQVNGEASKLCKTFVGVPQGSILGPKLFFLYINDLPEIVNHAHPGLFADDSTFCFASHKVKFQS